MGLSVCYVCTSLRRVAPLLVVAIGISTDRREFGSMMTPALTARIKAQGLALGFDLVGISPVQEPLHGEAFAGWLRQAFHGEMAYMARTAQQRLHPGQFLPWARSLV